MKNVKDIRWKSDVKQTPFAPEWDYTFIEGEIDDVDFDYISNYLLEKKDDILKLEPTHDGMTGLGMNSTTARHTEYNIFQFEDSEIDKLKSSIIFLHNELLKLLNMEEVLPYMELHAKCWYNVMKKGQKVLPHFHDLGPFCYLGGHITVQCDDTYTGYMHPANQLNHPYVYESKNKVGKITLFPNHIPHFTNIHNGDKERVTIAFDLTTQNIAKNDNYVRIL